MFGSRKYKMTKPKSKRNALKKAVFALFVLVVLYIVFFIVMFDSRMLPAVVEITRLRAVTTINDVISETVSAYVSDAGLAAGDFFTKTEDGNGKIQSLTVNSVLIDSICARLARDISAELSELRRENVEVPIGIMLGINALANYGPMYSVRIQPLGAATVDYTTSFESAGINQINFRVWLQVEAKITIVNPLQRLDIDVNRRVLLVDMVFAGEVPSVYLNR
jgi:sporulation protein YunB